MAYYCILHYSDNEVSLPNPRDNLIRIATVQTKKRLYSSSKYTLVPYIYRGALLSTLLHAIVYVFTQFVACTSTDCK
jgi:hypothetical protein